MSYLHNKGIVHQNLSTRNIFLYKEVAVVCDVGLASLSEILSRCVYTRAHTHTHTHARTHTIMHLSDMFPLFSSYETECGRREVKIQRGRLNYLAPEILRELAPACPQKGTIRYSTASDIYAFGYVACTFHIDTIACNIVKKNTHNKISKPYADA